NTYVRTGNAGSENITASIRERKHEDESGRNICQPVKCEMPPLEPGQVVYLTIGSRLQGLRRSLRAKSGNLTVQEHLAYLDSVEQMPEHWWGYEGVDLVILNTSDRSFVNNELLNKDPEPENRRKRALADWVRHGGRLVVAAGRNQDLVGQLPELS